MPIWGRCNSHLTLLILLALIKLLVLCLAASYVNCTGLELISSLFSLVCCWIGWVVVVVCLSLLVYVIIFSIGSSNKFSEGLGDKSSVTDFLNLSSNGEDENNSEGLEPVNPIGDKPSEIYDSFSNLWDVLCLGENPDVYDAKEFVCSKYCAAYNNGYFTGCSNNSRFLSVNVGVLSESSLDIVISAMVNLGYRDGYKRGDKDLSNTWEAGCLSSTSGFVYFYYNVA